jgi:hypothetical protein
MQNDKKESRISQSIKEKYQERYSFYKLHDLVYIIVRLMNAYEDKKYKSIGKVEYGHAIIVAEEPTIETKQLTIDTPLMKYNDLQQEYEFNEALTLFGFGPSDSRFKLNIPEDQKLDYIQDFADVLYDYRDKYELVEFSGKELDEFLSKYLEITKEEIELRKQNNTKQNVKK